MELNTTYPTRIPIPSYVLSHIAVGKIVYLTVFSSDHYLVSLERKYHSSMILRKNMAR